MDFDKQIWWARDGASILRQNGSDEHAAAVCAVCGRIADLERRLAEAEKDSARYEMLYELAVVGKDGKITIQLPLPTAADWDGVTCLWDRHVFRAAIDAAIAEAK